MPIYEYYCGDCKSKFNAFHSMDSSWNDCSVCGSGNITRVLPNVADTIDKSKFKEKAGDLVKSHIEEAKQDIKKQKEIMKRGIE